MVQYVNLHPYTEAAKTLLSLLQRPPPPGRKLCVVATTSSPRACAALGVSAAFHARVGIPSLTHAEVVEVGPAVQA